ncbi:MAG: trimethylamine methyltransferase family protein [Desulfobacteraceae bacterium]|jgi:trimethylamine:corrinoid methyltransferase-like protein|nr:trimethylamine methyltransferase family protein [Desulfobacteraceae bacterium]
MLLSSRVAFFAHDQMELMKAKVFELLEHRGVKMDHPEVLKLMDKAGATVDFDSKMVRLPKAFLEEQIGQAPTKITLAGRNGKNRLEIPRDDGTFHTRTNTGAQSWIDLESGKYRRITASDVKDWARLADKLDQISLCAFPVPSDVPTATPDVHALNLMLQNVEKHVWVQPYTTESVDYLIDLAVAAAGGEQTLRADSLVSFITCSLTPLEFKRMDLDIILKCGRNGIPLHACSLPGAGATAPITIPGVVLLAAAEIMAMLAAAQVVQPGIPIIATPLIFSTDMMTGRSLQSSAESMQGAALAVQFIKAAYGIPTHTYGIGSDSPIMDGQCMSEGALRSMLIGLSGADILGAAGQLEVATTISPVQLAIDNEVFGTVRRMIANISFDDDSLAWAELLAAEPGCNFLTGDHTLRHCRDGLIPINYTRMTREDWNNKDQGDLIARATEYCRDILEKSEAPNLPEDVSREMDAIVERADRQLG